VGLFVVAVILGSWDQTGPTIVRMEATPSAGSLQWVPDPDDAPTLVDVETGRQTRVPLPIGDVLSELSSAPNLDMQGRRLVVGRWAEVMGISIGALGQRFGLARVALPSGDVLDRVPTEILPISPPCWYPSSTSRILFTSGDGRLYQFDFANVDNSGGGEETRVPKPITWREQPPSDKVMMLHPCWPTGSGFENRLLVSLAVRDESAQVLRMTPFQLWWLRLDPTGTEIVACGRLIDRPPEMEQLRPTVARTPEGSFLLAYHSRRAPQTGWRLRVTNVRFDPETDHPTADRGWTLEQLDKSSPITLSADGQWLARVDQSVVTSPRVVRRRVPRAQVALNSVPDRTPNPENDRQESPGE
jgi:hypothetical protein